jgi:hypothetical protein
MKRKNFLRQMAVTLPVGIAAPQMLFGSPNGETTTTEKLIFISDGQSAQAPGFISGHVEITATDIAQLKFEQGRFALTDKSGRKYAAGKLIFSGNVKLKEDYQNLFFDEAPAIAVEFGEAHRSNGLLALRSYQLPQYHVRRAKGLNQEVLQQFIQRKRPGVMQLI